MSKFFRTKDCALEKHNLENVVDVLWVQFTLLRYNSNQRATQRKGLGLMAGKEKGKKEEKEKKQRERKESKKEKDTHKPEIKRFNVHLG